MQTYISIRLTSLALWQSNDCPSASKATLMNMDKYFMWIHYERLHNHNKAKHNKTMCIFLGIYCNYRENIKALYHCPVVRGEMYSISQEICTSFIMNSHEVFIHIHRVALLALGQSLDQSMYNHNNAQQSKDRVHISWDILYHLRVGAFYFEWFWVEG